MLPILKSKAGNYLWHENWLIIPDTVEGRISGRTHAMVSTQDGRIIIFHQASPAVLVCDPSGRLSNSFGDYPGAHGMTLVHENGREFLWLTDMKQALGEKTTLDGEVVQRISAPPHPAYREGKYMPTWVAVNEEHWGGNGDIWVADGYGGHLVHRYDATGNYLLTLDGSEGAGRFSYPHGIAFDVRGGKLPELYVADRLNKRVQVYSPEGEFKRVFGSDFLTSPDGFAFFGDRLLIPELYGRITLLDAEDKLIDILGENKEAGVPGWPNESVLEPGKFNSPHGAGFDAHGNIFIVEWRLGGRIIQLEKI